MQNVEGFSGVVGEISRNGLCLKKLRLEEASHLARVLCHPLLCHFGPGGLRVRSRFPLWENMRLDLAFAGPWNLVRPYCVIAA